MTEDRKQPRPILHRAGSAGHGASHGVVWNEQNLEENERIKATLNPVKINEPKTPYHELLPEDDVDVEPLSLEGAPAPRAVHAANGNGHAPQGNGDGDAQSANGNGNPDAGHRRFEALRKAHYGAAGAALKAHLSEDEEDK